MASLQIPKGEEMALHSAADHRHSPSSHSHDRAQMIALVHPQPLGRLHRAPPLPAHTLHARQLSSPADHDRQHHIRREEEPGLLELTLGLAETGIKTGMFVREGVLLLNLGQLILLAV